MSKMCIFQFLVSIMLRHDAGNFLLTFWLPLMALGIALSSFIALILVMGIGRVAFTS